MAQPTSAYSRLAAASVLGLACTWVGCRQNVYHEVYAEQNAREIRALEDRIYDYEGEYRSLEEELWAKEAENEQLRMKLAQASSSDGAKRSNKPKTAPGPPESILGVENSWELPSVLAPNNNSNTKSGSAASPSKSTEPVEPSKPNDGLNIVDPKKNVNELPAPADSKKPVPKDVPGENVTPPPAFQNSPQFNNPQFNNPQFNNPQNVNPGSLQQPQVPNPFPQQGVPGDRDRADASERRIVVPEIDAEVRQASAQQLVSNSQGVAKDQFDRRITGIFFHPSLCRGVNFDDSPEDDGVYIVLQPQNSMGEFVSEAGDVTVIAVDPTRPKDQERIARWTYTRDEMAKLIHDNGTSRGYHMPLRWQSDTPRGDHVQIFARYVLPDGKTLVAERKVMLHLRESMQSVWTPRATSNGNPVKNR